MSVAHGFRNFSLWSPGPATLVLWKRSPSCAGVWRRRLFTTQWPGSKKKDRKVPGSQCSLKGHAPQWPHFLPLDSTTSKVPNLQKKAQAGDQALRHGTLGVTSKPLSASFTISPYLRLTALPWVSVFNQSVPHTVLISKCCSQRTQFCTNSDWYNLHDTQ